MLNRYQEALNELKASALFVDDGEMLPQDREAINLLQKLVDKATPKKQSDEHRCPKCNAYIEVNGNLVLVTYCWHCGQRLGDVDDK